MVSSLRAGHSFQGLDLKSTVRLREPSHVTLGRDFTGPEHVSARVDPDM